MNCATLCVCRFVSLVNHLLIPFFVRLSNPFNVFFWYSSPTCLAFFRTLKQTRYTWIRLFVTFFLSFPLSCFRQFFACSILIWFLFIGFELYIHQLLFFLSLVSIEIESRNFPFYRAYCLLLLNKAGEFISKLTKKRHRKKIIDFDLIFAALCLPFRLKHFLSFLNSFNVFSLQCLCVAVAFLWANSIKRMRTIVKNNGVNV